MCWLTLLKFDRMSDIYCPMSGLHVVDFAERNEVLMSDSSRLIRVFTNGFRGIVVRNKEKVYCSDLSTSQGGEQTCSL